MTTRPLRELGEIHREPFVIGAVKRGMSLFVPREDEILQKDDTIYVVMLNENLESFLEAFGFRKKTTGPRNRLWCIYCGPRHSVRKSKTK